MKIYDAFNILFRFNQAAGQMLEQLRNKPTAPEFMAESIWSLGVIIPNIDDWWGIQSGDEDLYTRRARKYMTSSKEDQDEMMDFGFQMIQDDPVMLAHYREKLASATDPVFDRLRHLPHHVDYMEDVFQVMPDFQDFKSEMDKRGLEALVFLVLNPDVEEGDRHLHGFSAYKFNIGLREKQFDIVPHYSPPRCLN